MSHIPYTEIANEVKVYLESLNLFRTVKVCEASSFFHLIKVAQNLAGSPKALIVVGGAEYDETEQVRTLDVGIVILVPFGTSSAPIRSAVEDAFCVDYNPDGEPLYHVTDSGALLRLDNSQIVDSEDSVLISVVYLKAISQPQT